MKTKHLRIALGLLLVLALPPHLAAGARTGIEILHLGNEGFLLTAAAEGGEHKVVIDGLYGDGLRGYPAVPPDLRRPLEAATGRFAGIDLILVSHFHPDHFNAEAVVLHLKANPHARFVSTEQAARQVVEAGGDPRRVTGFWPAETERVTLEHGGVKVTALRLHHGDSPAQNLGLLVEMGGVRVLHMGDTVITGEEIRPLNLADDELDVVLVPYWYLAYDSYGSTLQELADPQFVGMHFPSADATANYFEPYSDLGGVIRACRQAQPAGWMAFKPGEARRFDRRAERPHSK